MIERIGIDKSVIYNFILLFIDVEKLEKAKKSNTKKQYVKLIYDDKSPVRVSNGEGLGELLVKDSYLGKFSVKFGKNNLTGIEKVNATLVLSVNGTADNTQNLNVWEYQGRIIDVFDYMAYKYGITADHSSICIKQLEMNATFYLEEPYEKYREPILLLIRNAAKRYANKKNGNNSVKYGTWNEADQAARTDKLETVVVKNSSLELKIYNKNKQLKDTCAAGEQPERDIMRIEYTIKDKRLLKTAFGDYQVASLTDEGLTELFQRYFKRDIVTRYEQWRKQNQKELTELVTKHMSANVHWTYDFLREIRQYAAVNQFPILFDIEDMKAVFQRLDKSKNASHKYKRFEQQCEYELDLKGNTRRIREIIDKVMKM